jgi:hypothetical protein
MKQKGASINIVEKIKGNKNVSNYYNIQFVF